MKIISYIYKVNRLLRMIMSLWSSLIIKIYNKMKEAINSLFTQGDGVKNLMTSPTSKFKLNQYSVSSFNDACGNVEYSLNFQRYYLFWNQDGSDGATWQRDLFDSIINFEPIGQIEWVITLNLKGEIVSIRPQSLDGQQRTRTFEAIWKSQVRLPGDKKAQQGKSFITLDDGTKKDVSGYNLADIQKDYPDYFKKWKKEYSFIVLESKLTKKEKHTRFVKVNNHNTLTTQDLLSSQDSPLSNYINDLTLPAIPAYKFMRIKTNSLEFEHLACKAQGKLIQEIIGKWLCYLHRGNWTNIGGSQIQKLWNEYDLGIKSEELLNTHKTRIEKVLATADYIITRSSKKFWKKRDLTILLITIDYLQTHKIKFDSKLMAGGYQTLIAKLKHNNSRLNAWAVEKGYLTKANRWKKGDKLAQSIQERDNTFASCYSSGDSPVPLEFVVTFIVDSLGKKGIAKNVDKKRAFTKDEKRQLALLQDCKCASCRKDIDVDAMSTYEADHIEEVKDGGETVLENGEALCLSCHQTKTLHPQMYKEMRERFDEVFSQQPQVA